MGKRQSSTPRGRVRAALRQLSLRCRERAGALKRDKYTCQTCGVKKSVAKGKEQKVEAHHKSGEILWEPLIDYVFEHLLVPPEEWVTICPDCHKKCHNKEHEP